MSLSASLLLEVHHIPELCADSVRVLRARSGTGYKERVSRPEVTEAARFAKYAIAAYGAAGFQYLHQTS